MMGYDTNPQYSPDGKSIAWQSMERDGYEADQNRLFIMNLKPEKTFCQQSVRFECRCIRMEPGCQDDLFHRCMAW